MTKDANIRYLTGYPASESWLFVSKKKSFYITDARYTLEAQKGLKDINVKCYSTTFSDAVRELVGGLKFKRIGFDGQHLTFRQFQTLKDKLGTGISLVEANNLIETMREIKDQKEIAEIRKALRIHAETLKWLKTVIKPGLREREIYLKLHDFVLRKGRSFSFSPIIASGPNSCFPHAQITDRRIKKNESVLVDTGIDVHGYKSDLTRMFFLGRIRQSLKDVTAHVRESQRRAISKIRDGVPAALVDKEARNYLARQGLADFFNHSLGHGVGLEIHESPRLSQKSSAVLKEGMVITIEPAVYLPNQFGVRIEDMVLVTKNGCEVLSDNID